ncbi:MAG: hypothetical protein MHM6MM_008591 [Cercozoa sp. M6MM]
MVEIKTRVDWCDQQGRKDERKVDAFFRHVAPKWFVQCFTVGIDRLIVGFRDERPRHLLKENEWFESRLARVERWTVRNMHREALSRQHWHGERILGAVAQVLTFVSRELQRDRDVDSGGKHDSMHTDDLHFVAHYELQIHAAADSTCDGDSHSASSSTSSPRGKSRAWTRRRDPTRPPSRRLVLLRLPRQHTGESDRRLAFLLQHP